MAKRLDAIRSEADRIRDDACDPLLKMLDDAEVSMQEIFDKMGWEPIPAELLERSEK